MFPSTFVQGMTSQPPSSTSLPSGLQNPSPPTFATFQFSPNFGGPRAQTDQTLERPRTLTERMGLGPRVIPFKPTSTPLVGPSSTSRIKLPATLDTEMLDTSVDGGKQPQTNPLPAPPVDSQPPSSTAEPPSQEKKAPPDIWEHAKLVQDEWASVERPSLPSVIHRAMGAVTLKDDTIKGAQGPQKITETLTPYPKNEHVLLPTGVASRGIPPPSVSSSRGPDKVKREEEEVKIKQEEKVKVKREELEHSLLRSNAPLLAPPETQRLPKRETGSTLMADVPMKEELSDQYFEAAAQRVQSSSITVNISQNPPFVGKNVEERILDSSHTKIQHISRENGTLNYAHSDMKLASPSTECGIEATTTCMGGKPHGARQNGRVTVTIDPPSSRAHHLPLQSSSISKPILPVRAHPPPGQTVNRQGNEPNRKYQGNTHREPASIHASDPRVKPSSGSITHLGYRENSTFRDTSDERDRAFTRPGLSTLPTRPSDSSRDYRRYSPRRGYSPPRHSDCNFEDRANARTPPRMDSIRPLPRTRSPHTPPPRTYTLPTSPHPRSPLRRASDTYNRQNERASDLYRPSRSRSRSPRRSWAEREYAHDQLSPRGPRNGDMKRGSTVTYPAHNIRPRSEWHTTANNNSSKPYRREFEDPYPTRSPEGGYDNYSPAQPVPSRQPARNGHGYYRPHRGSPGSDRQSPMSVEWEEPTISSGGNDRTAVSRAVSNPETSRRSPSNEGDVPIHMQIEPHQGLKRKRAEEEPRTELPKQCPVSGPEHAAKRRKIDEEDVEVEVSLANPRNSGSILESIPPTNSSLVASVPVTQPPSLEEYPSLPPLIPTGKQNKLFMRMAGNNYGPKRSQPVSSTRELVALTPTSSDDPDDPLRHQNVRGALTSSLAIRDATDNANPPAIARVSLKDRIHRNQSQNNPQATHTDSTLPSSPNTPTEDLENLPSRRASGSKPTLSQRASISETHQSPVPLLVRIDLNQTSVGQFGDPVVEVPDLRGPRQHRPHVLNGNEQDAPKPLQARVGLRADEAAPQRPRQGSKGGRGASSRVPPGGNLAARLD